ncbi:hypothetical protein CHLRE_16g664700v5 [Chlamydomonas reinhardtii]|uniref:SURF1-like protein n=1 Tax=Chlamydomonas reinhardtii TaxID=3055 RepID=A8JF96_CHLRE|nr:uncharacterized protein CHLRE_16g664700v5 [Chlamydomonas reinhardtii]PNW71687.1 hypothetical protein CHLRE_16g664700v5 [Chlamydomonas reinhardtii]|eukprot:XP_001701449.1 cytochrome c oxidase assembly protein [Chlamydomonas reinhardtii]
MRRLARLGWTTLSGSCSKQVAAAEEAAGALLGRNATRGVASTGLAATEETASKGAAAAVMFVPSAVCACLAYWQYERMRWKEELIATRERVATSEPVDIFSLEQPADYDKVSVTGRFLHEYSLYVGPRPRSIPGQGIRPGYLLITPMVAADRKGVVLVNRGWVPAEWKADAQAQAAKTIQEREAREAAAKAEKDKAASATVAAGSGKGGGWFGRGKEAAKPAPAAVVAPAKPEPVTVLGVIQPDEEPNQFMPANAPDSDEFHYIQREQMARTLGLPADTPLVLVVTSDASAAVPVQQRSPLEQSRAAALGGPEDAAAASYPAPKHVGDLVRFTTMPSDHRNYALIWATLCVVLAAMGRTAVTKPLRGPRIVDYQADARAAWGKSHNAQ